MFGVGDKHTRKRQEMTVKIAERRHKEKLARVTRWAMSCCPKRPSQSKQLKALLLKILNLITRSIPTPRYLNPKP